MAVTPNGKTLVVSFFASSYVDSFSIGKGGALTEHGPYLVGPRDELGVDITADSKYAIFADAPGCELNCYTSVLVYAINPDGSLGEYYYFGNDGTLGNSGSLSNVWLSPNGKYLFGSIGYADANQVITLNFTEDPVNVTYTGCTTSLKLPQGHNPWSLATMSPSGTGGELYVVDGEEVSLLAINPSTGCTREAPASPFTLSTPNADGFSLVAWPPRPF